MRTKVFLFASAMILCFLINLGAAGVKLEDAVLVWLFDEGKGEVVKDISGNGNDGTITGATWTDGKYGKGLNFEKGNKVGCSPANGVKNVALSATVWAKFKDFSTENQFVYIKCTGTASGRFFYFSTWHSGGPHNCIHLGVIKTDGNWGRAIATAKMFDKNEWYHIAGVVDTKAGTIKAYVNGELKHSAKIPTGDIPGKPAEIWVGGTPENYQWAQAVYDELAIFNVALTEDEIKEIMNNGLAKTLGVTPVAPAGKLSITWGELKRR